MTKQEARRLIRSWKMKLSTEYRERANQIIFKKILHMEEFRRAEVIFCYVSMEDEVNTWPVIAHALKEGKRVGVPLCTGDGIMEVREITSLNQLVKGAYGIMEPDSSCREIQKKEIQLGLIPCVSADREGRRLGHGAGYYDRYLQDAEFKKAALCWEKLMLDQIPADGYDICMDWIISDGKR